MPELRGGAQGRRRKSPARSSPGTLTTLLVFGPIVFVRGPGGGAVPRSFAVSVVTSVGASLVLALTLMPVMMTWQAGERCGAERSERVQSVRQSARSDRPTVCHALGHRLAERYERGMMWCLAHPGDRVRHRARASRSSRSGHRDAAAARDPAPGGRGHRRRRSSSCPKARRSRRPRARSSRHRGARRERWAAQWCLQPDRHRHRRGSPRRRRAGLVEHRAAHHPGPGGRRCAAPSPTGSGPRCRTWRRARSRSIWRASRSSAA